MSEPRLVDVESLARARAAVENALIEGGRLADAAGHAPHSGSQALTELLGAGAAAERLKTAAAFGELGVMIAGDHAGALLRVLEPPVQTFAPWTLARASLEAASQAVWFFDRSIDATARIQRTLNHWLDALREKRKWLDSLGDHAPGDELRNTELQMESVKEFGDALGLVIARNGNGFGTGQPTVTQRIRSTLDAEQDFRLLSAQAHGAHWSSLSLSLRRIPGEEAATQELTPEAAGYLLHSVFRWAARGNFEMFAYYGWHTQKLAGAYEACADVMHLGVAQRFWRTDHTAS